jgi:hypothetical protein
MLGPAVRVTSWHSPAPNRKSFYSHVHLYQSWKRVSVETSCASGCIFSALQFQFSTLTRMRLVEYKQFQFSKLTRMRLVEYKQFLRQIWNWVETDRNCNFMRSCAVVCCRPGSRQAQLFRSLLLMTLINQMFHKWRFPLCRLAVYKPCRIWSSYGVEYEDMKMAVFWVVTPCSLVEV